MTTTRSVLLHSTMLAASTLALLTAAPAAAQDSSTPDSATRPEMAEETPGVVIRDGFSPNLPPPAGSLDQSGVTVGLATGVNGVGQMFTRPDVATTGLGLCTGTLINPRTVLFAAHCVNTQAANTYGTNGVGTTTAPNGTPISFGFAADNLPGVRQWLGLAPAAGQPVDPALRHASNPNRALYNVEQVWYDPRSLGPNSNLFLEGDVALATLDTPAYGVPTWALLFSPVLEETHVTVTGYGNNGTNSVPQGIDFRRRAAENMLSSLSSLNDRNDFLFGGVNLTNPQSLYMVDFDSPEGISVYNPAQGRFDFNIYGSTPALPREGLTSSGDSGGPLIVDQLYDRPVVVGTLSGGSRFFTAQRQSTYGTHSLYQPLFLFWDVIVQNNNYIYAGAKAGIGNWEDPNHWVQLMDPNYFVDRGSGLVNDLPDTPALGVTGNTPKFGQICFLTDCEDLASDPEAIPNPTGDGTGLVIAGGPGSTMFVPNNRSANPKAGVSARYYDVRLTQLGNTRLNSAVTIDMLTLDGPARLNVAGPASLSVIGEVNQLAGWTNVDGTLRSGGDMLFATGVLSGSGTLRAPFVTVAQAIVAPGGVGQAGTLTVNGSVILASGTIMSADLGRSGGDRLTVVGDLTLSQSDSGAKPTLIVGRALRDSAPRFGQTYTIASATAGVTGTFGNAVSLLGVLRPELSYTGTEVRATMKAMSFLDFLGNASGAVQAFGQALDQLRGSSYSQLSNLYGAIDWMDRPQLASTLSSLAPQSIVESRSMLDGQSRQLTSLVAGRLSLLGTGQANGLTFSGQPARLLGMPGTTMATRLGLTNGTSATMKVNGISGFVTTGGNLARSGYGSGLNSARRDWHMASGLEMPLGDGMFGTAIGFAESRSTPGSDRADSRITQAAAYGSLPLGGGAYVGAMMSGEVARTETHRLGTDGASTLNLQGIGKSSRITGLAELGWREGIGRGLFLTPRVQLGYDRMHLSGFNERGGETALRLDGLAVSRLEGRIGARLDGTAQFGEWTFKPAIEADHVRLLDGGKDGMTVRFAAAPDVPIVLPLGLAGSSWSEVRGGLELSRGPLTIGLRGETAIGGQSPIADQRGAVDFTFRF